MISSSKTLYFIIILIFIIVLGIYFIGQRQVEAAKVTIEITQELPLEADNLNESERDELIGNISIDKVYVSKFSQPEGNEMSLPGISVGVFKNKIMISDWISVPIYGKGIYNLTLGLKETVEKGDILSIAVYVNDIEGNVIIGKRMDGEWQ